MQLVSHAYSHGGGGGTVRAAPTNKKMSIALTRLSLWRGLSRLRRKRSNSKSLHFFCGYLCFCLTCTCPITSLWFLFFFVMTVTTFRKKRGVGMKLNLFTKQGDSMWPAAACRCTRGATIATPTGCSSSSILLRFVARKQCKKLFSTNTNNGAEKSKTVTAAPAERPSKRITIHSLQKMKQEKIPITMVTAYEYPSAVHVDVADIDILLVGDR